MLSAVRSWWVRWPLAGWAVVRRLRNPVRVEVRWVGFGTERAVFDAEKDENDRLADLKDANAGDER